jgi:hypothetical protein
MTKVIRRGTAFSRPGSSTELPRGPVAREGLRAAVRAGITIRQSELRPRRWPIDYADLDGYYEFRYFDSAVCWRS